MSSITIIRTTYSLLKQTLSAFSEDECPRSAAALAYYTVFSLPPLLTLILASISLFYDPQNLRNQIEAQISTLIGPQGTQQILSIVQSAELDATGGVIVTLVGVLVLLFGATGAFAELQASLNKVWHVAPDPASGGVKSFLVKRLFSFGMALAIAFLLLVSLLLSAVLAMFGDLIAQVLPSLLSQPVLMVLNFTLGFLMITLLFATMFKVLPDARVAWRDVWIGAAMTALLFSVGKFLLGVYLGQGTVGSAYGAAGSLAILLAWIYYSALILFLGAEFTQVWAARSGRDIEPEPGAVRLIGPTVRPRAEQPSHEAGHRAS